MEVRDEFVADVSRYSGPLREAGNEADRFDDKNSKAALAARRMGLAAKEAADKAARAMSAAGDAAEKLAMGEIKADEAAQAEAKALREVERAAIKAAEAEKATARAADEAARQYRQAARDAELAAAAEKLGALKASGAVKDHNALLKQMESRFGDLSKEGDGAFQEIAQSGESAFADIGSSGPGAIALVVAALAAVPFAAVAAESAISLGIGGALAGVGLMATKSDTQVQTALHNMTSHVKAETKQLAAPFKQTWLEIAKTGQSTFDALAPELKADFAVLAPAVSRFAADAGVAITRLAPAFHAASNAAATLMDALGPQLPTITQNLGNAITIMANSAAKAAPAFANMMTAVSQLLPPLAHTLDLAVRFGGVFSPLYDAVSHGATSLTAFHDGVVQLSGGLISSNHGLQVVSQTFPTFAQQATIAASGAHQLMTAQQAAALSSNQLKAALDNLTGANQNAFDAETAYRQALVAANAQARASNAGIRGNSAAAIANRQALSQLSGAIKNVETSGHATAGQIEAMRQRFISAAHGMGLSRAAAEALATKLLGVTHAANTIPHSKSTSVSAPGAQSAAAAAYRVANAVRSIPRTWTATVTLVGGQQFSHIVGATGGQYHAGVGFKYAAGGEVSGYITGPGTGTSDSIPAPWLSNGEFVTREQVTSEHLAALTALNRGMSWMQAGMAGGEKYAKGGKVHKPAKVHKPTKAEVAASHRVTLARSRPEYLAAMAAQHALESMRKDIYGGLFRGGPSTPGSAHGSVVQHVTTININVAGSIRSDKDLAKVVQRELLTNRMPTTLPVGR